MTSRRAGFWKLEKEEFNTQHLGMTASGELVVKEGHYLHNVPELARKYGTPLEIFLPHVLETRVRRLMGLFNEYIKRNDYRGRFYYHYPMKVNQRKEFVLTLITEGANLETSSANELWLVKRLWEQEKFSSRIRVLCNGPKTGTYLDLISELDKKGLMITPIIEEPKELEYFRRYKGEVGIRVDMDVKVRSHWDKRFNHFGIREQDLLAMGKVRNLAMLSYHISSQIEKVDGFTAPIRHAVGLYARMRELNPQLDTINIGGGGGVPYVKRRFYTGRAAVQRIVATFKQSCARIGVREPNIVCEWGRYVAAPAQISVFRAFADKPVGDGHARKWYTIDGSFINDLADTWGIHQKWHIIPANRLLARRLNKVWLAGSSCDSDDKYTAGGGYVQLPELDGEDQYIAVLDTGAYQDSLGGRHCLLSQPAKIMLKDGDATLVRERETPEQIGASMGW